MYQIQSLKSHGQDAGDGPSRPGAHKHQLAEDERVETAQRLHNPATAARQATIYLPFLATALPERTAAFSVPRTLSTLFFLSLDALRASLPLGFSLRPSRISKCFDSDCFARSTVS